MKIYESLDLLYDLLMFTVLVPVSLALMRWRQLNSPARWAVVFLVALLIHELLAQLLIKLHTRNHFLYYLQTVAVLYSVAGVYTDLVGSRRLLGQIATIVSVLMVIEVSFWVGFNHINSVTLTISRLLPAIYASITLNRLFLTKATQALMPNPLVYIHLGFFLFGAFTAINAYFKSYFIETSLDLYYLFNTLSALVSAVTFGLFSIGFFRIRSVHMA